MKAKIDFGYFCIYNYFFRDNNPRRTVGGRGVPIIPEAQASLVMGGIIYFFILSIRCVYKCFLDHQATIFLGRGYYAFLFEAFFLGVIFYVFYQHYVVTKKIIELYGMYKITPWQIQGKVNRILIVVFIFFFVLPFVLLFYWIGVLHFSPESLVGV
ncbi:MAG TPA: hypothetical protein VNT20_12275 [Flavisolibacter sp.]|jgi:hypothetical protein|nr:hypothetical protein [Flavisolibacter sp.]